jgi:hypothetical protein
LVVILGWVGGVAATPAFGQGSIEPDRPDVTNGAHLVDVGVLQFEIGGFYTRQSSIESRTGSPISMRFGVRDWVEAHVSLDGGVTVTDADRSVAGFGNVQIGVKIRLWSDSDGKSRLSLAPQVNVPTASVEKGLGTGQTDYVVAALTGFDIGSGAHLDVNYGMGAIGTQEGEPRFAQHQASASLSVAVGRLSPFFETFAVSRDRPDGERVVAVNVGGIYLVNPRLAVDGGVELGLTENAPSIAAFAGFSFALAGSRESPRSGSASNRRQTSRRRGR